ncbi:MAG: alpha/beta fold hydrolase [Aliiglaciecola sp.]|uniref:alpha/beta hydrolase n=1 Tax=Aliiglaciecola sp. M165 TaxID=2593649 RepID=UPI0011807D03|nr:alpha/beta fold hydrolase [Aliiglaciecola sp. M165]TRY32998.1 alpha/beta hydrolase [Aliiglaciecola sp. M165]
MNIGLQLFRAQNRLLSMINPSEAIERANALFFTPKRHDPKSWEEQAESAGQRVRLKNGVSAIVWGQGTPILLMHGWEGRATQMAGFIEPLTRQGFQLIALDAPAHGRSLGNQSHPMRFVESMRLAEETYGPFYAVIGHSMGGGCSIYCALEGMQVEKVISIAGPANFKRVSRRFANFIGMSQSVIKRFVEGVEKTVGIPFAQIDLVARAAELKQPLLLVHDSDDKEIPISDAQQLAHAVENSTLVCMQGLGHRKIMRDSVMIDTVVNFIVHDTDRFLIEAI